MKDRDRRALDAATMIMRAAHLGDRDLALQACTLARELAESCEYLLLAPVDWTDTYDAPPEPPMPSRWGSR